MTIKELNNIFNNHFLFPDKNGNFGKLTFSQLEKLDLIWTLLLHDIGKFESYFIYSNNRVHYYNHENIGYEKFLIISFKLKFSNTSKNKIKYLIKNHLRIFKVFNMKDLKAKKFMLEKYFKELIIIGIADNLGRTPRKTEIGYEIINFYADFLKYYSNLEFYNGNEILNIYPNLNGFEIKNMLDFKNNEILLGKKNKQSF